MVKQPETRAISCEALELEFKGIYAGLTLVETKCIEVDGTLAQGGGADGDERN